MKRRLFAALAAVVSAALGAGLLLSYVAGADRRAMAGMQITQVLVTTRTVPAGTTGAAMADLVVTKTLPVAAVAPGAVQQVAGLAGLVSTAELEPGEQVLASRFADPATLVDPRRPLIGKDLQQVSLRLDSQRVVGGALAAGDHVGVFVTIDKRTRLALPSVLVAHVGPPDVPDGGSGDASPAAAPEGSVDLTLALSAADATQLVSGAESGSLWLSLVTPGSSAGAAARPVTVKGVLR